MAGRLLRLLSLGLLLWGAACGLAAGPSGRPAASAISGRPSATLTVFAAASLTEAFTRIGRDFSGAHPQVEVIFNFAGSQQLAQQLVQGAPADVYASADARQMQAVVSSGRVLRGAPRVFARNQLVVIYPADNPAGLAALGDLSRPGVRLVLAAPEVPAGGYGLQFIENASRDPSFGAGFAALALKNVVSYEENVRAVLAKVLLGEADAGIVYASDLSPGYEGRLGRLEIPLELNVGAEYPLAPLADSSRPELAARFIEFVLGPAGQAILLENGFVPISAEPEGE